MSFLNLEIHRQVWSTWLLNKELTSRAVWACCMVWSFRMLQTPRAVLMLLQSMLFLGLKLRGCEPNARHGRVVMTKRGT